MTLMNGDLEVNSEKIERLVQACRTGDRNAFNTIVRLHQHRAMQVAVGILCDTEEAAEVVQDSFVKAFLKIYTLRDSLRLETWLLRIVSNAAINRRKAIKRRNTSTQTDRTFEATFKTNPEHIAKAGELKQAIQKAMQQLPKKQAMAITLFCLQDMPQKQVAQIMGCSTESVRWHVFRARRRLEVLLKEYL